MLDTMAEVCSAERIDEGAVDLDLLNGEAGEVREARIAGAEIVHGDGDAELIEALQGLKHGLGVLEDDGLGDFEVKPRSSPVSASTLRTSS